MTLSKETGMNMSSLASEMYLQNDNFVPIVCYIFILLK